ncbi:hypothetical protein HanIR_Chr02g0069311 [Helianthus annuus]|nr:hypothetical protein HanIR_Chr02g0069311 [Helianthus annuus]
MFVRRWVGGDGGVATMVATGGGGWRSGGGWRCVSGGADRERGGVVVA